MEEKKGMPPMASSCRKESRWQLGGQLGSKGVHPPSPPWKGKKKKEEKK